MVNGSNKKTSLAALREAVGNNPGAQAIIDKMTREQARASTRNLVPSKVEDYLVDEVRARYAGQDFIEITKTLAKTVFTADTAGKRVSQRWAEIALEAIREHATPEEAAAKIGGAIEAHGRSRDTARRKVLAFGLTELQIRQAEALGQSPLEYVRPIRVTGEVEPALSLSYGGLLGDAGEQDGAVSE